jgi:biopolymer transport protein ExbB/TolQ
MSKQVAGLLILAIISVVIGAIIPVAVYKSSQRFSLVSQRRQREEELKGEGRKFEQELEEEGKRKKEVEETLARYKKKFGKNFAAILKADIDEFKKERGLDAFRRRFAYDLFEYETNSLQASLDSKYLTEQEESRSLYKNVFGVDIFGVEMSDKVIKEQK